MREWEIWTPERVKHYHKNYGTPENPQKRHRIRMGIAASMIEGETVLDVACGLGHLYPHVGPRAYLGVDNSLGMLEEARRLSPDATFMQGDVYDLSDFAKFGSVVCQSLLIHLPDTVKPIQEMWTHTWKVLVFSTPIGLKDNVRVAKKFGDRHLLFHIRSMETMTRIIDSLPEVDSVYTVMEPKTPVGNTYFKITKK